MSNPPLLFCDADATIQILLADQQNLLKVLHAKYGIQPVLVYEAENEIRQHKKHRLHISARFEKALATGVLKPFDLLCLQTHLKGTGVPPAAIQATWDTIQAKGREYEIRVHPGEAYTHAAALILNMPSLSHDSNALHTLLNLGLATPSPVLRFFDLLALGYQTGILSSKDCDSARSTLMKYAEWVPSEFVNANYVNGLNSYCSRILDYNVANVGAQSSDKRPLAKLLYITQL